MTVHLPYGFATDGGTDTETNDGSDAVTAAAVDPEREDPVKSLTDPTALRERDDVIAHDTTYTHETPDHCEATAAGRVIVGATTDDDDEVLLLVRSESDHVILPNAVVESGDDWATVARRTVAEETGTTVRLDGVEYVRTVDHVVETDEGTRHQNATQHVLFHASPVGVSDGNDPTAAADGWRAGWYDELPVDPDEEGDVIADIRTVLE
ncbi:NUDIX domain-containing protein [Halosimplex amylolyticum]|uniref:NUDIX domain-containing protein n=1 Tax=Halosimplex amylolyticum TaxID=3396616 RepID=UPI003F578DCF